MRLHKEARMAPAVGGLAIEVPGGEDRPKCGFSFIPKVYCAVTPRRKRGYTVPGR